MTRGGIRKGAGRPKGLGKFGVPTQPVRVPEAMVEQVLQFAHDNQLYRLPLFGSSVSAGFPSVADDHIESRLNLNELLIKHPAATFFVRVKGNSMINAGIHDGDILVVDKSLIPMVGKIVIAAIDGELTVKRLDKQGEQFFLKAENSQYKPIPISDLNETTIWGVVTTVLHSL